MSRQEIEAIWKEYNEMYGLDMEMPEELVDWTNNFDEADFQHRLAMGDTFDGAMQHTMNF